MNAIDRQVRLQNEKNKKTKKDADAYCTAFLDSIYVTLVFSLGLLVGNVL